jgi:hypothetical protein
LPRFPGKNSAQKHNHNARNAEQCSFLKKK